MKNIKLFEEFSSDILNNVTDPRNPITRDDLVGPSYGYRDSFNHKIDLNKEIVYALEFVGVGTFTSFYNAENYLKDLGYEVGSMDRNNPIGFIHDSPQTIPMWGNLNSDGQSLLDGVIVPSPEFREGDSIILFFNSPKF